MDKRLADKLAAENLDFIQFAWRWVNCLLIRELPFPLSFRLVRAVPSWLAHLPCVHMGMFKRASRWQANNSCLWAGLCFACSFWRQLSHDHLNPNAPT